MSLVYQRRSRPIYITNLDKKRNSNFSEKRELLLKVLNLFSSHQKVILGDREFCSMELTQWLKEQKKTYFSVRLKKSLYIERSK